MEEDLKILKVEYLNNNLMYHTQIVNLSLDNQLFIMADNDNTDSITLVVIRITF
jgi:hypothetical protein